MNHLNRREFFQTGVVWATLASSGLPGSVGAASQALPAQGPVHFIGDGLFLSPPEYARLLVTLTAEDARPDSYMAGGAVERLE